MFRCVILFASMLALVSFSRAEFSAKTQEKDGLLYFSLKNSNRIECFDLERKVWLEGIELEGGGISAFLFADSHLYLAEGKKVSRYDSEGELKWVIQMPSPVKEIFQWKETIIFYYPDQNQSRLISINADSGVVVDKATYDYELGGLSFASQKGIIYGVIEGGVQMIQLSEIGRFARVEKQFFSGEENKERESNSTGIFVSPDENKLIEGRGRIYRASDLLEMGEIEGAESGIDDVQFYGEHPIVLMDDGLEVISCSVEGQKIGQYQLKYLAFKLALNGDQVFAFSQMRSGEKGGRTLEQFQVEVFSIEELREREKVEERGTMDSYDFALN